MPVEVIKATYGFYIPMDGAWQSEEDNAAFAEAEKLFNELKVSKDYVALIQSFHTYTHGYWLETTEVSRSHADLLLKEHKIFIEKPAGH